MSNNIPGTCYTNAGAAPNTACVKGVWKYQGLPYKGCANPSAQPLGLWCPTEVTANGDYISGKWGACDMELDACNGNLTLDFDCFTNISHLNRTIHSFPNDLQYGYHFDLFQLNTRVYHLGDPLWCIDGRKPL